jgi:hypothetical protein
VHSPPTCSIQIQIFAARKERALGARPPPSHFRPGDFASCHLADVNKVTDGKGNYLFPQNPLLGPYGNQALIINTFPTGQQAGGAFCSSPTCSTSRTFSSPYHHIRVFHLLLPGYATPVQGIYQDKDGKTFLGTQREPAPAKRMSRNMCHFHYQFYVDDI